MGHDQSSPKTASQGRRFRVKVRINKNDSSVGLTSILDQGQFVFSYILYRGITDSDVGPILQLTMLHARTQHWPATYNYSSENRVLIFRNTSIYENEYASLFTV